MPCMPRPHFVLELSLLNADVQRDAKLPRRKRPELGRRYSCPKSRLQSRFNRVCGGIRGFSSFSFGNPSGPKKEVVIANSTALIVGTIGGEASKTRLADQSG